VSSDTKCVSFDVFDTCLARRVAAATEVFRRVGHRIAERGGERHPEDFAAQFIEWRCQAERRARAHSGKEDLRLREIWEELRKMASTALAGADGPALEIEAERSVLGAIPWTRERAARERNLGRRILFISDMYLPAEFLRECLRVHGFFQEGDGLYVSGEIGLTKWSGNLFRHVLGEEKLAPAELLHVGDHALADREVPRRLGIAVDPIEHPRPHPAESLLLRRRPHRAERWIESAGKIRFIRLTSAGAAPSADLGLQTLVEGHLGPLLCLWGHWILRQAREDRIERLYFASRDARLAWTVCRKLSAATGAGIDCRYLHISRQAVYLPSALDLRAESMPWLCHHADSSSLSRLAAKLEINPAQLRSAWLRLYPAWGMEEELTSAEHWNQLWRLLASEPFAPTIARASAERRVLALAYFRRAGLLEPGETGLVDLGSQLYCQEALNRLCAAGGKPQAVRGYYLYLRRGRRGPSEAGAARALFEEDASDLPEAESLSWIHRTSAIEHILGIADHASVRGYESDGSASFAEAAPAIVPERFSLLETSLLDYAGTFGGCWEYLAGEECRPAMSALIQELIQRPLPAAVASLRDVRFPIDPAHRDLRPLVEPYRWSEIARDFLPGRHRSPGRVWPEAGLIASSRSRRWGARAAVWSRRIYGRLGMA
jgi:FMN phosphatase YigB (HAD superfamily)